MWDYGLDFCNEVIQDEYSLFSEGYCIQRPRGWENFTFAILPSTPRGHPRDSFFPEKVRSQGYAVAWSLDFLDYTQHEESVDDYPAFLDAYLKDVSGDQAYIVDMYTNPSSYATYDILASLFTLPLAKLMGDFYTIQRIENFLYGSYNKVWTNDGREMHFDTLSLIGFLQPIMAFFYIWAHTPVTVTDLATARPAAFWDYPYISEADDDYIWVYQAEWDSTKEGFILNIKVDTAASLTFSNFDHIPTAYSGGVPFNEFSASNNGYTITLQPGTYQLVIM